MIGVRQYITERGGAVPCKDAENLPKQQRQREKSGDGRAWDRNSGKYEIINNDCTGKDGENKAKLRRIKQREKEIVGMRSGHVMYRYHLVRPVIGYSYSRAGWCQTFGRLPRGLSLIQSKTCESSIEVVDAAIVVLLVTGVV